MSSYNDDIAKLILKMIKNQEKKAVKKVVKKSTSAKRTLSATEKKAIEIAKKNKDITLKAKGPRKTRTIGKDMAKQADAMIKKKRRPPEPPMAGVR